MLKPYLAENFEPPTTSRIIVGDSIYVIMYNFNLTEGIDNMTCSRIDECHPKGRGVWKCKWYPRRIETCDACEEIKSEKPVSFEFEKYAHPIEHSELNLDTTEPSVTVESVLSSTAPLFDEPIALVFSGDAEPESKLKADSSENESEQINEHDFMKDETVSEDSEVQYSLVSDSDVDKKVQLEILKSILDEDVESSSEVVYAIESADEEDGESEIIISTDGLLDGNIILLNNISDLDEAKYTVVGASPE